MAVENGTIDLDEPTPLLSGAKTKKEDQPP